MTYSFFYFFSTDASPFIPDITCYWLCILSKSFLLIYWYICLYILLSYSSYASRLLFAFVFSLFSLRDTFFWFLLVLFAFVYVLFISNANSFFWLFKTLWQRLPRYSASLAYSGPSLWNSTCLLPFDLSFLATDLDFLPVCFAVCEVLGYSATLDRALYAEQLSWTVLAF